jgi:hypothetical protein
MYACDCVRIYIENRVHSFHFPQLSTLFKPFLPHSFLSFSFSSSTIKPSFPLSQHQQKVTTKWFITTVTINSENPQTTSKMKSHYIISWIVLVLFIAKEQDQSCCLFFSSSLFSLVAMFLHLFSLDPLSLYLFYVSTTIS